MPLDVEVLAVQYPGRMNRHAEPRIDTMEPMAAALTSIIARDVPGPFALFGHSMGAAIAFETTLQLARDHGRDAVELFVSGRKGPALHRLGRRHLASDDALVGYLRVLGGTSAALFQQPELWPLVLPLLRSDFKLSETWEPDTTARVRCPLTALTGDGDPEVSVDAAARWADAAGAGFELRVYAGHHFFVVDHEQAILEEIARSLAMRI